MNAKKRKPEQLTIDRGEAQTAKRALQQALTRIDTLRTATRRGVAFKQLDHACSEISQGITALRDADGNEASRRPTE